MKYPLRQSLGAMRLDPGCPGARLLLASHGARGRLLGQPGRLGEVVLETNAREVREHVGTCLRCAAYQNACPRCGRDLSFRAHKLLCPDNKHRWATLLGRAAPPRATRHVEPPPPRIEPPKPRAAPAQKSAKSVARVRSMVAAYAALGLAPGASPDAVRAAYHERARLCHPDVVGRSAPHLRDAAVRSMQQLNAAYEQIRRSW